MSDSRAFHSRAFFVRSLAHLEPGGSGNQLGTAGPGPPDFLAFPEVVLPVAGRVRAWGSRLRSADGPC